ncbi:MAG: peptide ligase PGM1-related protein [Sorangiineae bacterium]|nr:peptide ligase PGM1-related protein [Polyangiaceae bacterium]MEB2322985.1 peptide ligase PGM1-related protein [Sorangiineae bacterium]
MTKHPSHRPPPPPTPELERHEFKLLQQKLAERWQRVHDVESGPSDIVVIPSLSLDGFQLGAIPGINHYEERMLFTLGRLRNPRARLVYVTSQPLDPALVDYYLALLGGIPTAHARQRVTLLSTYDGTPRSLTEKVLERPRLIQRIRDMIDPERAHMTVFTVSPRERQLAVALGIPLYGVDPELLYLGTKSGSRAAFREAGVSMPPGVENVRSEAEVAENIATLWEAHPTTRRMIVKLDQGFSGAGNAVLSLAGLGRVAPLRAPHGARVDAVLEALTGLDFASRDETWPRFRSELERIGGVVELYLEGRRSTSPSAQLRINPRGQLEPMSTHDQVLGGASGQVYLGCRFPADDAYRLALQEDAMAVGRVLVQRGCIGRVGVDFITVEDEHGVWSRYAVEINLRMTGTTHPIMTMKLLNDGAYDPEQGLYLTRRGEPRFYVSTDTLMARHYRGLLPEDLLDIAAIHELHYQPWKETGVVFHLLGALSQYGKLGLTAIGSSMAEAQSFYDRARETLDRETLEQRA